MILKCLFFSCKNFACSNLVNLIIFLKKCPSFFICFIWSIISWISNSVQRPQKELLFLQDSCSGPSRFPYPGRYDGINDFKADFRENPASLNIVVICVWLGNRVCHLLQVWGTSCPNHVPSMVSGVSVIMVSTPPGFRTR